MPPDGTGKPPLTTLRGAAAAAVAIMEVRSAELAVKSLQVFAAENRLMTQSPAT